MAVYSFSAVLLTKMRDQWQKYFFLVSAGVSSQHQEISGQANPKQYMKHFAMSLLLRL